jgi:BASS family bile acid:Na+ symporter
VALRFLAFLGRRAGWMLVAGICLGLASPAAARFLRPSLSPLVFILAAATMIRIDWPAIRGHVRQPMRLALALAWGLLLSPVAAAALTAQLPLPPGLVQAIVIWAASPPLISSPALAFLLGLDGSLALLVMVLGSLLMPLTLPPIVLGLVGVRLEIGILALMGRLTLFIGGAVALAALLRRLLGNDRIHRHVEAINGANVLLLMLFAIAIMDGVPALARTRPQELLLFIGAAFAASLIELVLGSLAFLRLGRVPALTIGLISGYRNMASVWASLGALAPPETTLFLVAVQLPIYILPALLRPLCRRLGADSLAAPRIDSPPPDR